MAFLDAWRRPRFLPAGLLVGALVMSANASAACTTYWNVGRLGETQLDSIALYNLRGAPVAHITNARLRHLVDIKNRLTYAANVKASLWLCDDTAPQAYENSELKLIVFSIGMLNLLEWNADAIAGVMAHEVAHLELGHSGRARGKKALMKLQALTSILPNGNVMLSGSGRMAPVRLGGSDLKTLYLLLYFKYSREDEQHADNEGAKLMTRIGINPAGALRAQVAFLRKFGNREGGYFDLHPAMKERVKQSRSYLASDSAAKALTVRLQFQAATDKEYSLAAEQFIKSKSWKELDALTDQWLSQWDKNALALYYRGIYLSAGLKDKTLARGMFYNAVVADPGNPKARLELCVALFEEGRKLESVYCYRNITNEADKEAFRARTFGDNLWVGGEIEPFTSVVVTRDESGGKYVTNLDLARERGLAISNFYGD